MDIDKMTRKQFDAVPFRGRFLAPVECDCLVVLPCRAANMHASGYRCMDFVAVRKKKAICRLSGCSDVIHIDGIGGYGEDWLRQYGTVPHMIPVRSWNIDCLAKSGLLRIWCSECVLRAGAALSSFELFARPKARQKEKVETRAQPTTADANRNDSTLSRRKNAQS